MQYLLTEDEYKNLIETKRKRDKAETEKLQEFCTFVANNTPIVRSWSSNKGPRPWNCILTHANHYCDECPAKKICPNPNKEWSK
jgi:hypothetical protein